MPQGGVLALVHREEKQHEEPVRFLAHEEEGVEIVHP